MLIKPTKNGKFKITDLTPSNLEYFSTAITDYEQKSDDCNGARHQEYYEFQADYIKIQREYAC